MKKIMYCYHVWEIYEPRLLTGEPLYEGEIYSTVPITTKAQIMECLKKQSIWYELIKDREFKVVPMSTWSFFWHLVRDCFSRY